MEAIKFKVISALFVIQSLLCGCPNNRPKNYEWSRSHIKAQLAFHLDAEVDECSGAIQYTDSTFLTHNDDGDPILYEVNYQGKIVARHLLPGAVNRDWEEVSKDEKSNIYAADIGNNFNSRHDMVIYKVPNRQFANYERINISYATQVEFPPPKKSANFDCEAFFAANDSLYLISKNRGRKTVIIYALPAKAGTWQAVPVDSFRLKHAVTGACYIRETSQLLLATYGAVYRMPFTHKVDKSRIECLRFARSGQAEAIWATHPDTFYVANEANKVFRFTSSSK